MARRKLKPVIETPFSVRIKELRQSEGLTMTALSQQIAVTPSYISLLEAGERQPSREIVLRLSKVFFSDEDVVNLDQLLVLAGLSPTRYDAAGNLQDRKAMYEAQIKQDPQNFRVYSGLIGLLLRKPEPALAEAENMIHEGMKHFRDTWRLQQLMAQLQLCRQEYASALEIQRQSMEMCSKSGHDDHDLADVYTNLGVIHSLWGSHYQREYFSEVSQGSKTKANEAQKNAKKQFEEALKAFQNSLKLMPDDLFTLDEIARVQFNLADMSTGKKRDANWKATLNAYENLLRLDKLSELGHGTLLEINAWMMHSCTKAGHFFAARQLLNSFLSLHPDYWFGHYVKALHYGLGLEAGEYNSRSVPEAVKALQKAAQLPNNQVLDYLSYDPDLTPLKEAAPKVFEELMAEVE